MYLEYLWITFAFLYPGILLYRLRYRRNELLAPHTLISLALFGWVLPQAISFYNEPSLIAEFYLEYIIILLSANLILLATQRAWIYALKRDKVVSIYSFSQQCRIARVMVVLCTIVGLAFRLLIYDQDIETRGSAMWTGTITILFLFSKVQYLAFIISIWGLLLKGGTFWRVAALVNLLTIGLPALLYVHREQIVFLVAVIGCGVIMLKKVKVNIALIGLGVMIMALIVDNAGVIRGAFYERNEYDELVSSTFSIGKLIESDFKQDIDPLYSEFGNAVRIIRKINQEVSINLGARFWDYFVFAFVPAQIVGDQIKQILTIYPKNLPATHGVDTLTGYTVTVFADLYEAYGLFGFIAYFCVALLFSRAYVGANNLILLPFLIFSYGLIFFPLSITHGFIIFITRIPELFIFTYFFYYLSIAISGVNRDGKIR
jgi:hypothetical protein